MRDPEFFDDREQSFDLAKGEASNRKKDIWQHLSRVMLLILLLCCAAAVAKMFWPEIEKQRSLVSELERLESIQEAKVARATRLRREYELLQHDQTYLESVARDRLDLAADGETIIRIERNSDGVTVRER